MIVNNDGQIRTAETDQSGYYLVKGLKASRSSSIIVQPKKMESQTRKDIVITEGQWLKDIDFVFDGKVNLRGKVIDKASKFPLNDVIVMLQDDNKRNMIDVTDKDGNFSFMLSADCQCSIFFDSPEYYEKVITVNVVAKVLTTVEVEMERLPEEELND